MNLVRSDEQRMLQDSALSYLSSEYGFAQRALSVQHPLRCRDATWRQFAEMGWLALPLAERCGGLGGSEFDLGLLTQELGRHRVVEPFHACAVIAARLLCEVADGSHAALLAEVAGGRRLAFAHQEAGGIDPFQSGETRVRKTGNGFAVSGRKRLVAGAPGAGHLLVSARDEAGAPALLLVDTSSPGLERRLVQTADDGLAADVAFADTPVIVLARGDAAVRAVRLTLARAHVALAWDACGAMDAALRGSVDYTTQRVQFGQPISRFQVIQHRLAEMAVALEEARAACELASTRLDAAPGDLRVAEAMAALVGSKVGRCARFVAQEAVQVHGAMGVCEELPIAATFRRLTAFGALTGTAMRHSAAYGRQALAGNAWQHSVTLGAGSEPDGQGELQAFRAEVRAFIGEHLTDEMRVAQQQTSGVYPEPRIAIAWQRALAQRGWLVPLWPREWSGTGWSSLQRIAFENECMLAGAPLVHPMGVRLVGPVILRFGTEAQKQRFLPRILSSDDYWCQGFSEPGAGSDLASLKLQAAPDGDNYVLNGSKIWTTHAQHANWMFALVRTGTEGKRQDGISFLLVDMASPGITVRPIATIGGDHDVNEVFFENVRVPQANRVGAENAGWECAKYLLEFERGAGIFGPRLRSQLKRVGLAVAAAGPEPDDALAIRFGEVLADLDTFERMELRALAPLAPGQNPGPVSSILKLRASRLKQAIAELGVECLGPEAIRWHDPDGMDDGALAALVPDYANSRAATIFGGAAEVQLGIIAKTALAL